MDLISSDDLTVLKNKIYEEYNKDRVFFTSTINNNCIEELKKYILKELSKFKA